MTQLATGAAKMLMAGGGPAATAGGVAVTHSLLVPMLRTLLKKNDPTGDALRVANAEQRRAALRRLEEERLQKDIQENIARIAATRPQLYNDLLAGEKLAPGERKIGGRKRTDIIEALALRMAQGDFQPRPNAELAAETLL